MVVLPYNQKGSHKRSSAKGNYSQWASKYSVWRVHSNGANQTNQPFIENIWDRLSQNIQTGLTCQYRLALLVWYTQFGFPKRQKSTLKISIVKGFFFYQLFRTFAKESMYIHMHQPYKKVRCLNSRESE